MKKARDYLNQLIERADEMSSLIKKVKQAIGSRDYDLDHLLKSVEADFMDMKHKIDLAYRLAQGIVTENEDRKKRS